MAWIGRGSLPLVLLAALVGCGDGADAGGSELDLVVGSTQRQVYEDAIVPAFQRTRMGRDVEISMSSGPSDAKSRAVATGEPADVVALSADPDMTRPEEAGVLRDDWKFDNAYRGHIFATVVAFVTRPGNPKRIEGWEDLLRDDVEPVMADPTDSDGAKWGVVAAYGSQVLQGRSKPRAREFVRRLLEKASIQRGSAIRSFLDGDGDVLIGFESQAIAARRAGAELHYLVPRRTIMVEAPAAATSAGGRKALQFVHFLRTEPVQRLFAARGYRPIIGWLRRSYARRFPDWPTLFTVAVFGGWDVLEEELFDPRGGLAQQLRRSSSPSD